MTIDEHRDWAQEIREQIEALICAAEPAEPDSCRPAAGPDRLAAGPDRRGAGPDCFAAGPDRPAARPDCFAAGPDRHAVGPDRPAAETGLGPEAPDQTEPGHEAQAGLRWVPAAWPLPAASVRRGRSVPSFRDWL